MKKYNKKVLNKLVGKKIKTIEQHAVNSVILCTEEGDKIELAVEAVFSSLGLYGISVENIDGVS